MTFFNNEDWLTKKHDTIQYNPPMPLHWMQSILEVWLVLPHQWIDEAFLFVTMYMRLLHKRI